MWLIEADYVDNETDEVKTVSYNLDLDNFCESEEDYYEAAVRIAYRRGIQYGDLTAVRFIAR